MSVASERLQGFSVNPWVRGPARFLLWLKRQFLLRRVRRHALENIDGVPLVVWPDVLNPVVFRSGEYLARSLRNVLPERVGAVRALDMGTGSGASAIFAAKLGCRVTAVDLNPEAARCARVNVLLNGLEEQVDVRCGDLFEPVSSERFDVVMFNPPFFRGQPKSLFDMAWRSVDVPERFASGLAGVLNPGGEALILLSTEGYAPAMLHALAANGFDLSVAASKNFGSEILTIYRAVLST